MYNEELPWRRNFILYPSAWPVHGLEKNEWERIAVLTLKQYMIVLIYFAVHFANNYI